ncbi:hypothetical protein MiAbW_03618 [Microcystis aeruginosa NIES-4325]|uniref:Uncharacterized protein n=1 Tax=Microcystis aeruginosa NIES-4325 TaxID=2569534 RepID=A0A5J4FCJ1_MICAE|nr:hypothetical protein MiAbW_03618 [Microcystis aeruginosa NIES-4325]
MRKIFVAGHKSPLQKRPPAPCLRYRWRVIGYQSVDTPGPKGVRILEAHHCAFWFPLLTSYTIMSEPRLLEYQLLSSFPFCGSLSKRFPISRKIRICPTLSVLRQKFLFDSFSLFEDLLPCLKSFRWLLSIYFYLKSAALFQQNFHDVRRHCNLKTLNIVSPSPPRTQV